VTRQLRDTCPHCGASLLGEPIPGEAGTRYQRAIGVEFPGLYDGVLFETCPYCWGTWHQWDPIADASLWEAAEKHRARFTKDMTIEGARLERRTD